MIHIPFLNLGECYVLCVAFPQPNSLGFRHLSSLGLRPDMREITSYRTFLSTLRMIHFLFCEPGGESMHYASPSLLSLTLWGLRRYNIYILLLSLLPPDNVQPDLNLPCQRSACLLCYSSRRSWRASYYWGPQLIGPNIVRKNVQIYRFSCVPQVPRNGHIT